MGELERQGMSFVNGGELICVGTSRNQMVRLARDALRVFGPQKARRTIDEHIANLIEVERESYRAGFTRSKKKTAVLLEQGDGQANSKGSENDW
ncbi:hypothetical protein KZC52_07535 [Microbacterium sp. kSW2-24]|uniref:hypothetical protein n=1 Tax=Microbacterium galbinum TaxID=2851646 RepID=UPI001FFDE182|nr:hypothetical protein [Microbacterium galbinum]MCK2022770.1 hypothetical protein [Microbacterium galbinum]